jgi:hypothetical protein
MAPWTPIWIYRDFRKSKAFGMAGKAGRQTGTRLTLSRDSLICIGQVWTGVFSCIRFGVTASTLGVLTREEGGTEMLDCIHLQNNGLRRSRSVTRN